VRYYIQHSAGLGELVSGALASDLDRCEIVFRDDSGMIFDSSSSPDQVQSLRYVRNSFQVLITVPRGSVASSTAQLVKQARKQAALRNQPRRSAFRTMVNVDGQLVGLPRDVRSRLESVIAEQTGGRLIARGGSGLEYWVVGRRDLDVMMLCLRLGSRAKESGVRGSLSGDLSTLLVKASNPSADDVFLDPFGGSGAIVEARIASAFRTALYSDIRLSELRSQLSPRLVNSRKVRVLDEDALTLPSLGDGSISVIVTDPPWGEHEDLGMPYIKFAEAMMRNFDRVLDQRRGRLVLLVSRRAASVVSELWEPSGLDLKQRHEILVHGHPATVLVGGRAGV
jgi:Putative RNA methylase family UPF0020